MAHEEQPHIPRPLGQPTAPTTVEETIRRLERLEDNIWLVAAVGEDEAPVDINTLCAEVSAIREAVARTLIAN